MARKFRVLDRGRLRSDRPYIDFVGMDPKPKARDECSFTLSYAIRVIKRGELLFGKDYQGRKRFLLEIVEK